LRAAGAKSSLAANSEIPALFRYGTRGLVAGARVDGETLLNFSISGAPTNERREVLREHFGRGVLNLDFEPTTDNPRYEFQIRLLPGVVVTYGLNTPHVASSHDLSRESDDFLFVWGDPGGRIRQNGHEVTSGDYATLLPCADRVEVVCHRTLRHRTLRIDRSRVLSVLPHAEAALAGHRSTQSESFGLLQSYLTLLNRSGELQSPHLAFAAATHICDLVALTVGATGDGKEIASARGLRAARQARIKHWVLGHLQDPAMSVCQAALAEGVSPRYVQMLFEAEGTTFSAFVLAERLALARRRLADPVHAGRPVSDLVYDSGFGDLSYFNRAFRAAYGETPSDVRHKATSAARH
jgi:AraC-like DNA-binding protein